VAAACLLLACSFVARADAPDQTWQTLSPEDWRADLHQFAGAAPQIHKNFFHTLTPEKFQTAVKEFDAAIPSLDADARLVGFMRLAAMIQDGHSGLDSVDLRLPQAPIRFIQFDSGVYVEAVDAAHSDLVGAQLVRVGGVDWRAAMEKINALVPHDPGNDGEVRTWAAHSYLNVPVVLKGLGLTDSATRATYTVQTGRGPKQVMLEVSAPPAEFSPMDALLDAVPPGWASVRPSAASVALSFQHRDKLYWFQPVPERRAVYVAFRGVWNQPGETLVDFAGKLADHLNSHDVDRVVVDIRDNPGGDNTLLRPLLVALIRAKTNHRGGLWVLISQKTFSADQNFVDRLESYTDPIFVGMPTAQNVNFYGDPKELTLQRSHLGVALAALWWQDKDPRDHRLATAPEIAVTPTFADLMSGHDAALDVALTEPAPATLEASMQAVAARGAAAARTAYDAFAADPRHRFIADREQRLNRAGYQLLSQGRSADAVAVFQVAVDVFPQSANAAESLGEGLEAAGKPAAAKAAYIRALAIDPSNSDARERLKQLGGS
jgi:hypothetical protein